MSTRINCSECVRKQEEIYRLREEIQSLKAKLRYQERKITEGYFGSETPSSQKPFKLNSPKPEQKNRGGAKVGHQGHGRRAFDEHEADIIEPIDTLSVCPDCGDELENRGEKNRAVIDVVPVKVQKILYKLAYKHCKGCKKNFIAKAPGVLPKYLYSNNFLAYVATEHYLNGMTLGQLERKLGIGYGSLIEAMHKLARILKEVPDALIETYRAAPVKHADETGWRNDGQNGYAWLFATPELSIFRFRQTRSSQVVKEVLGEKGLPGVLVVDRYQGYNKVPCSIQYCYAHLLRNIQDLEKEFPDNKEIKRFVERAAPLLAEAMNLRSLPIEDDEFYRRAQKTEAEIIKTINAEANHAGIQKIQNIFREHTHRLYHWAENRSVPAENNLAERELRPLVIARKISFGSHSESGAKTREILMTVLFTLKKKTNLPFIQLKTFLDKWGQSQNKSPTEILFQ